MNKVGRMASWKQKARELELQTYALYLAYRDPRLPWYAKAWVALVLAYAFSPIDLIPDFIPVLGYLDDLILVPLGVFIALRMIPPHIMDECLAQARQHLDEGKPQFKFIGLIVIGIWMIALFVAGMLLVQAISRPN
jgi:uncharacterized membrane protein YkvA (DUF1232 family)